MKRNMGIRNNDIVFYSLVFGIFMIFVRYTTGDDVPVYHVDVGCYYPPAVNTSVLIPQSQTLLTQGEDQLYGALDHNACATTCYNSGFKYTGIISLQKCQGRCEWQLECRCLDDLPQMEAETYSFRCPYNCNNYPRTSKEWCLPDYYTVERMFVFQAYAYSYTGCYGSVPGVVDHAKYIQESKYDNLVGYNFAQMDTHSCATECVSQSYTYVVMKVVEKPCETKAFGDCYFLQCGCTMGTPVNKLAERSCPFQCHVFQDYQGGGNWCFVTDNYDNINVMEISLLNKDGSKIITNPGTDDGSMTTTQTSPEDEEEGGGGLGSLGAAGIAIGIVVLLIIIAIVFAVYKLCSMRGSENPDLSDDLGITHHSTPYTTDTMTTVVSSIPKYPVQADDDELLHVIQTVEGGKPDSGPVDVIPNDVYGGHDVAKVDIKDEDEISDIYSVVRK